MSAIWKSHAAHLTKLLNNNNASAAHLYLEQLMLFPVDVQDKIIEDISQLGQCTDEAVAAIINNYSMMEWR